MLWFCSYTCFDIKQFAAFLKDVPFIKASESKYFVFRKAFKTPQGELVENKFLPCSKTYKNAEERAFDTILPSELFLPPVYIHVSTRIFYCLLIANYSKLASLLMYIFNWYSSLIFMQWLTA